jgi:hypothetical protein
VWFWHDPTNDSDDERDEAGQAPSLSLHRTADTADHNDRQAAEAAQKIGEQVRLIDSSRKRSGMRRSERNIRRILVTRPPSSEKVGSDI